MARKRGFDKNIDYRKLFKSYQKDLEKEIKQLKKKEGKDYKWKEFIASIPDLFNLLLKILVSRQATTVYRVRIIMAFAYLFAPIDVVPEEVFGLEGYIDDFVVLVMTLHSIKRKLPDRLIISNWSGEGDIMEFLDLSCSKAKSMLNKNVYREFKRIFDPE